MDDRQRLDCRPLFTLYDKNNTTEYPKNRFEIFEAFHDEIYREYDAYLQGPTPIRMKMLGFWEYFSQSFSNPQKHLKIKKANNSKTMKQLLKKFLKLLKSNTFLFYNLLKVKNPKTFI